MWADTQSCCVANVNWISVCSHANLLRSVTFAHSLCSGEIFNNKGPKIVIILILDFNIVITFHIAQSALTHTHTHRSLPMRLSTHFGLSVGKIVLHVAVRPWLDFTHTDTHRHTECTRSSISLQHPHARLSTDDKTIKVRQSAEREMERKRE